MCGEEGLKYRYSGQKKVASGWNKTVEEIKKEVEEQCEEQFNFALLNYYKDGNDYIGPHSDDCRDLVEGSSIASVSFGASRDFKLFLNFLPILLLSYVFE